MKYYGPRLKNSIIKTFENRPISGCFQMLAVTVMRLYFCPETRSYFNMKNLVGKAGC